MRILEQLCLEGSSGYGGRLMSETMCSAGTNCALLRRHAVRLIAVHYYDAVITSKSYILYTTYDHHRAVRSSVCAIAKLLLRVTASCVCRLRRQAIALRLIVDTFTARMRVCWFQCLVFSSY